MRIYSDERNLYIPMSYENNKLPENEQIKVWYRMLSYSERKHIAGIVRDKANKGKFGLDIDFGLLIEKTLIEIENCIWVPKTESGEDGEPVEIKTAKQLIETPGLSALANELAGFLWTAQDVVRTDSKN